MTPTRAKRRLFPILMLLCLLSLFLIFRLDRYLSFESLQQHHQQLLIWTKAHLLIASLIFLASYTLAVAASFPGAVFLTLLGGLLFGPVWGFVLVVVSATLGACIIFLAVRYAFADWLGQRASGWVEKMRRGFKDNAFSYLLTLRLVPVFPFWVVNIVPAVLGVSLKTFVVTTFLGIIPGSLVYVLLGNSLGHLLALGKKPDLGIIFDPQILIPLLALAALSLLPVLFKKNTKSDL